MHFFCLAKLRRKDPPRQHFPMSENPGRVAGSGEVGVKFFKIRPDRSERRDSYIPEACFKKLPESDKVRKSLRHEAAVLVLLQMCRRREKLTVRVSSCMSVSFILFAIALDNDRGA